MRVFLFSGADYYPSGGWGDFAGEFPTVEAAQASPYAIAGDWAEIVDVDTKKLLFSGKRVSKAWRWIREDV